MPTIFSHAVVAVAVGTTYVALQSEEVRSGSLDVVRHVPARFWLFTVVCALLPDMDVIGHFFRIPYDSVWGHRGITHSLPFALAVGVLVVGVGFPEASSLSLGWWSLVIYFFAVTASHAALDAMTNGGLGIAFFAPFDDTRYFFSWRPIEVSPIGIRAFFSGRSVEVLMSELRWLWVPVSVWLVGLVMFRRGP
jgi:inner membrane protein